ncbi:MAG: FHA domain-containing protein [Planctomycetes bacterium]|nr:FHA domain-containing protein [Planctomycetota bacterium]
MSDIARITVTAGPDKGRVFDLSTEMVRLGRSPDNEIAFTDQQVLDHHASIVCREGRFAIHTSVPDGIEVDGTLVPPERWVWLPDSALIRLGERTSVAFVAPAAGATASEREPQRTASGNNPRPPSPTPSTTIGLPRDKPATKTKRPADASSPGSDTHPRAKRTHGDKGKRTVARFITDGPGDPLVKLGEDGHLPELTLSEAQAAERRSTGPKKSNPVVLMAVMGLSIGLTLLMLFMEVGEFGGNARGKAEARREIREYYGKENEVPKRYQESLREAQRAHSRKDREAEQRAYRDVLAQLRSEAKDKVSRYTGLTGRIDYDETSPDKKSDKRLEELIGILLSE